MKRQVLLILVLVLLVLAIPAQAQDEITVWLTGSDTDATILQEASVAFTEETGIVVNVEAVPWSDSYTRSLTATNSGIGADIIIGGMSWGISLGNLGGLVDLGETFGEDTEALLAVNNPAFVEATIGADGVQYAVPYSQDVHIMYYSTAAFEEAGIEGVPATWEEFTAALDALEEAGLGGGAYGWGNASWLSYIGILGQAGGSFYSDDCSAVTINSDEGLEALEYYTMLFEEYGFPAEQADPATAFSTGEYSIVISGEWHASGIDASFPELEGQWSVAPLPAGPSGSSAAFLGGRMAAIFSYSTNQDAAFQFLEWVATPEAAEAIASLTFENSGIFLPAQPENGQFIQGSEAFNEALNTQLADVVGPPSCTGWEESQSEVDLILQSVLFEGYGFEDALLDIEDLLNEALEEFGS